MRQDEAERLVAKLFAAFPYRKSEITAAVYVERVLRWDFPTAKAAVEGLIDNAERLPTIVELRQAHNEVVKRERLRRPALEAPKLTEEQRAENLRRLRELTGRYQLKSPSARLAEGERAPQ